MASRAVPTLKPLTITFPSVGRISPVMTLLSWIFPARRADGGELAVVDAEVDPFYRLCAVFICHVYIRETNHQYLVSCLRVFTDHQGDLEDYRMVEFPSRAGELLYLLEPVDERVAVDEELPGSLRRWVLEKFIYRVDRLGIETVDRVLLKTSERTFRRASLTW